MSPSFLFPEQVRSFLVEHLDRYQFGFTGWLETLVRDSVVSFDTFRRLVVVVQFENGEQLRVAVYPAHYEILSGHAETDPIAVYAFEGGQLFVNNEFVVVVPLSPPTLQVFYTLNTTA